MTVPHRAWFVIPLGMFYWVYFFSPFNLRPALARLLSRGLVASEETPVFLEPLKAADTSALPFRNVLVPHPRSPLHPGGGFLLDL